MDHAEVRELLELAAVEPNGLDRLMAGDTPDAAAVAAHLAGCAECTAEMAGIRRGSGLIRDVIRTSPPTELRARTLAFVAAVGRDRSASPIAGAGSRAPDAGSPPEAPVAGGAGVVVPFPRRGPSASWLISLAAAVAISVVATGALLNSRFNAELAQRDAALVAQGESVADLAKVSKWSLRVSGEDDAQRVTLAASGGGEAAGTVLLSRSSRELVVVATGLAPPPPGQELRCWLEVDGQRTKIGKMFFGADLAYWVGEVPSLQTVAEGVTFGVSLADASQPADVGGDPVISGQL